MNGNNEKLNSKEQINSNQNSLNHQQIIRIKSRLMKKHDISSEEADKILDKIITEKKIPDSNNVSKDNTQQSNQKSIPKEKSHFINSVKNNANFNENLNRKSISLNNKDDFQKQISNLSSGGDSSVDEIMESIIPEYNQSVSIELNHVDLTFEVATEKIDSLKETFIKTIKRAKSKKIKIHALNDISFKIYKGEKVGIIGYNGAGKSTLLNVITGIYPPDNGSVKTQGNISPLLSLGAGFDHNFSGRRNIILNGAVLGYDKDYLESKMDEIIEFSELGEFIDIPIKNYSSGMMAKLGFSIATAVEPDILIIDEILGVGDVNFQKKSGDKIRALMDGGTTVLLVSHSIPQIRELCDKAIWIDGGNLREFGEVNKVCDHYLKDAEKASNEQLANIQFR